MDPIFDPEVVNGAAQEILEGRALQALDEALEQRFYARNATEADNERLQNQVTLAEGYEQTVIDSRSLRFTPQPFGTYHIQGYIPVNPITGRRGVNRHFIEVQTIRVRRFQDDEDLTGTFGLETTATINGRTPNRNIIQGIIDPYLKPLKEKHAIIRDITR